MTRAFILLLNVCWLLPLSASAQRADSPPRSPETPSYTSEGRLQFPRNYREWIYLTSGLDMSYSPRLASSADHSMFDNTFVNPEAYRAFVNTGTWPDKTMLLLELRGAETNGSINKAGHFQGAAMGLEVHVKDAARGGWAFYEFDGDAPAAMVPKTAACYSCHQAHAAVDTTFVQFYPTLLPIATSKSTLSAAYLKELPVSTK